MLKYLPLSTCSMAWLSAVKLDEGVRLQGKSTTFPLVLEVIAFPSGSKSTGGTISERISCKVNSTGENTEPSGLFCSDRSDSDTVRRVCIESDLLLGKTESTGSA